MSTPFDDAGIAVLGPFPPRTGGVSVQCDLLAGCLEREGARVTRLNTDVPGLRTSPLRRSMLPLAQVAGVVRGLRATRPTWRILHVHAASWWGFMPAVAGLLGRGQGRRLVLSYHGGEAAVFLERWGGLVRSVLSRYDAVLALTPMQARVFRSHGVEARVVPNIVPVERFPFRLRAAAEPRLLWLRQLEPRYRPADALDVLERVQAAWPEACLTMVGGGALAAALAETAAQRRLGGLVLKGQAPLTEVASYYDAAGIFLNTSAVDNQPLTLIEASACGLPIVSTNAGAIPDLICHDENGLLAPVGDPAALAGQVLRLLDEPALAQRLSAGARKNAGRFAWAQVAPLLAAAYGLA